MKKIITSLTLMLLLVCSCNKNKVEQAQAPEITPELAYEGVNNYCHKEFDWSPAKDNPSIMYVAMGDETETEYKVIFRSYTGSLTYFYVNKKSGKTRMEEFVPALDITQEAGSINLFDYVKE